MANKVPVPVENIAFERLDLSRHYLTVDCDFTCFLVLNPSGSVPSEGTDICALHTGAWQIDAWTLLTKKDFPNQAGFSACLVWDRTLVSETVHAPQCVESDIDTANSVSSLKGQPVNITGFSMPAGQVLPVAVYANDIPVSVDNPLSTIGVQEPFVFKKGDIVNLERCRSWCSEFHEHEEFLEVVFYASAGEYQDNAAWVRYFPWFFTFKQSGTATKYVAAYPFHVKARIAKDTHEVLYAEFYTCGTLMYSSGPLSVYELRDNTDLAPEAKFTILKM